MKIKVCGMKFPENIFALSQLEIDYMGLIFYPKSSRFVNHPIDIDLPKSIDRVGVFVNAELEFIKEKIETFSLDVLQLHGDESPEFCKALNQNILIIKAFSIENKEDFEKVSEYKDCCDYFLFDTKTSHYGGSGQKFDWSILECYTGEKPFFLSGGISEEDVEAIKRITHPAFLGIDLNSRFEIESGLKDIIKLEKFINDIRS